MADEPLGASPHSRPSTPPPRDADQPVSLLALAGSFLRLGSTTFGGMWAATNAIEAELVHRTRWVKPDELQFLLLAANLIPAPKFIALGGLVGYRLRGWPGSILSVLSLIAPGTLLVVAAVVLLAPDLLDGPLAPLRRAVGIAVVGLLFGNAYQQLEGPRVAVRTRVVGVCLGLVVAAATLAGVPLLVAALAGFAVGAVLIREGSERDGDGQAARNGELP